MPVLSGTISHGYAASSSSLIYLAVGCAVIFVGAIFLRGKRNSPATLEPHSSSHSVSSPPPNHSEKQEFHPLELPLLHQHQHQHQHTHAPPPMSPHALPFTPPTLFTSSFSMAHGMEERLPSNEYYDSPTEMGFTSFNSFEPPKMRDVGDELEMPRRRSYTKTSSNGSSFSGEILQSPSFRRHTRVYGTSSPCLACEESERRMSA